MDESSRLIAAFGGGFTLGFLAAVVAAFAARRALVAWLVARVLEELPPEILRAARYWSDRRGGRI